MPPEWLLWLLPVPLATLGAIAWVAWSRRPRGPQDTAVSVREHERFRAALAAPVPPHARPQAHPAAGPDAPGASARRPAG